MMLNNLLTTLKNRPVIGGLLAFVLLAGGLTLIFAALTPPSSPELPITPFMSTNFNETKSEIRTLKFTGTTPEIPAKLPITRVELNPVAAEQLAQQLIEKYQLQPHARSKNIWLNGDISLFRDERNTEYVFSQPNPLVEGYGASSTAELGGEPKLINEPKIVTAGTTNLAQTIFQDLFGNNNYQQITSNIKYLTTDGDHFDEVSANQAEYIEVPFATKIANYPVYVNHLWQPSVRLLIDAEGNLIKAMFQFQIINNIELRQVPTISVQQAVKQILAGQGSIISASQEVVSPLDLKLIYSGTLTDASIEYRADLASAIAFPVYRFSGKLLNSAGNEIAAEIITPAVLVSTPAQSEVID